MDNRPIGLLDSGVGGLTVLRQIMRRLPNENTIFIGDQARLPYGTKSAATILQFGRQLVTFLQNQNVKLIVIACNTVTAVALPRLQKEFTVPIIGVIAAGSQAAVKATHNQKIGVIATPATIESQAYQKALQQLQPQIQVHGLATPEFVTLVENCQYHSVKTQA
ncbi:MAG: glutamate racemase, partial [Bombilactobacillus sp.]